MIALFITLLLMLLMLKEKKEQRSGNTEAKKHIFRTKWV